MELLHLGIDSVQGGYDFVQHQRCGDFKDRVVHIFSVGACLVPMEVLDKGEDQLLHGGIHLWGRGVVEFRPFKLSAFDNPLPNLHLFRKDALVRQSQHGTFHCPEIICCVQVMDEH